MKILHIINYFQPQIGYQETFLAKEQIKQGHEVSVITSDRYYPFVDFDKTYKNLLGDRICGSGFVNIDGIPIYRLKTLGEIKCRVWLLGLEQKVKELKPDYVHVHAVLANAFRMMKLKKKGMKFKLVVDEHIIELDRSKNLPAQFYNFFKKRKIQNYIKYVDKYVGAYRESCQILKNVYGVPDDRLEYIPLGADSSLFKFREIDRANIRKKFKIPKDDILLVYTGKINEQKGIDTIIKAFNHLSSVNISLLFVGSVGKVFMVKLKNLIDPAKKEKVFFHGFVLNNNLPQYYSAADICVWGDGISISMLEATSCGRPIVVCDLPPVKERIEYGNGLTYEFGNAIDLKKKLEYLIRNPKVRIQMGKRGRQLVEDRFSWEKISERFLSI